MSGEGTGHEVEVLDDAHASEGATANEVQVVDKLKKPANINWKVYMSDIVGIASSMKAHLKATYKKAGMNKQQWFEKVFYPHVCAQSQAIATHDGITAATLMKKFTTVLDGITTAARQQKTNTSAFAAETYHDQAAQMAMEREEEKNARSLEREKGGAQSKKLLQLEHSKLGLMVKDEEEGTGSLKPASISPAGDKKPGKGGMVTPAQVTPAQQSDRHHNRLTELSEALIENSRKRQKYRMRSSPSGH
mmetsp:Transcript_34951/g.60134  ORF Transcript_34951/g.60134 Transcript_34951/m.60134 type:complete len:248 (+) Transcript_34951:67-810(+)|eukprot:CAMPEP_0205908032 /NCGR_PEP_ID=MMETSP1325-20131115/2936_1 /ASSEMBLY_ACC=CAM_ASM_000708 /TAXON_ID=236786 /ORGANISM="Florenciella sp., Strain RCC1007" /LENGTH=247 /DNA_ID=CAMNT_0053274193 /DNA_START=67 /DNA_END=810 /DNA_ORIENTATION=+